MATVEDNIPETAVETVEDNIPETVMAKVKDNIPETAAMEEWMDEENDEVSGELEDGSGLETKRRRQIKVNEDIPAVVVEDAAGEDKSDGDGNRSYLDDYEGSKDLITDSSSSTSTESEFFVAEKELRSGNSALKDIMDVLQIVPEAGVRQDLNHIKMGNGLNSSIASVDNVEDEIVAAKPVTQSHVHNGNATEVKLDVSDLDLERVLEEQETHDLFCPNCYSCITRRVILRKRKRRVHDFEHEERPGKFHVTPNIIATSVESVDTSYDNESDVFRCLSCFSYFSRTENGFNIFRIFQRRGDSVNVQVPNVQSSGQTSARGGSLLSSIFKPESSKKKENEAVPIPGTAPPEQSHMTSDIRYPEQNNQTSTVLVASETASFTENAYSTNAGAAVRFPPQLEVSFGGDYKLEEHQSVAALPIPVSFGIEENFASNGKTNSATQFPVNIKVSSGGSDSAPPPSEAASGGGTYATNLTIITGDVEIKPVIVTMPALSGRTEQNNHDAVEIITPATILSPQENDEIKPIVTVEPSSHGTSQTDLSITISAPPPTVFVPLGDVHINVGDPILEATRGEEKLEVLKSIVYGGLIESITSLGVLSSAAGAETSTLKIVAIGSANLIGGFFVILHSLAELKSTAATNQKDEPDGRYWKLLGRKSNFRMHATVAIISYIVFGLLPAIIYGFSFRKSDEKEYKLMVVAASSFVCIALLAIGKAHVSEPKSYGKTFFYYLGLGCTASGLSYVAGVFIGRFLEQLGLFENNPPLPSPPSVNLFGAGSGWSSWAAE
ncbi:hypothetical protein KSP40_PGU011091 [Platanthera guangdongensis]|uniref:Membrane protein of ER body-like protein n=1 Tax=Platanthera guangdongensis TaxID=2320717 RepID=A0ABR2M207_9ASPA